MPVHFNYQGHVGTNPGRQGGPSVPSRLNIVTRGAGGFTKDLERALADHYPEQYAAYKKQIEEIHAAALALIKDIKDTGMQHAQRP